MLGSADIAFLISSSIVIALFIPTYYKLYRKWEVSRRHKIVYAIIFPVLMISGGLSIFVFHFLMDWKEVLMFNVIWVPFFLLMLQDLAANPLIQKFHMGTIFATVGLIILLTVVLVFIVMDILNFASTGEWIPFLPLPTLIVLVLIFFPLFILTARLYGKGEEEFTNGDIKSGAMLFLYAIIATFGFYLSLSGLYSLIAEDSWIPSHVGIISLIIGLPFLIISTVMLFREKYKRKMKGWGW